MRYIIAGIHTGIGKTVVAAVLSKVLNANYWKPVQAGVEDPTDTETILGLLKGEAKIIPERYILKMPASPHIAAHVEGIKIQLSDFELPQHDSLIVETAGGIMSPLGDGITNLDLMQKFGLPVILVIGDYLGSINHSLLSIELLKSSKLTIKGLVFSGAAVQSSRDFIVEYSGLPVLAEVPHLNLQDDEEFEQYCQSEGNRIKEVLSK
ncbi:MAG TPA: dethiobiotin synthase [Bacteroidia bacterium]